MRSFCRSLMCLGPSMALWLSSERLRDHLQYYSHQSCGLERSAKTLVGSASGYQAPARAATVKWKSRNSVSEYQSLLGAVYLPFTGVLLSMRPAQFSLRLLPRLFISTRLQLAPLSGTQSYPLDCSSFFPRTIEVFLSRRRFGRGLGEHRTSRGMDTSAFIAPARISVLLVPIHPIKRSKFEQYASRIRGFSRIDLSDVPPDSRGERGES
jgi:hypothetical protein